METFSWILFHDALESESPVEVYKRIYSSLLSISHYICAPITSPAGLDIDPGDVQSIKQANWEINIATVQALYQVGALSDPTVFLPAAIGLRKQNGKYWGEFDHSLFNTMVSLRIDPSCADEFVARVQFSDDEILVMNNYSDQGKAREEKYFLFEENVVEATEDVEINPLTLIVLHRYHLSFGCRYEMNLARRIQTPVYLTEGHAEHIRLTRKS